MRTSAPGNSAGNGAGNDAGLACRRRRSRHARQSGFTLIELMVVVMLIAAATAGVSLALRDSTQDRLDREAVRLATLLEAARAEARAAALPVIWRPTPEADDQPFRFVGLAASHRLPTHWLDDGIRAQVDGGRGALVLGPEPLIGAQRVILMLQGQRIAVATDGLRPFAVQALDEASH
ncbi:MAG TPA: prepilin-type N-terminal cleavage/methylation domain-containing protein [Rubrivivax sp.]|nr:prepilin-type N-terminal cleavage/methylation domain-containing protein [Burkholderiales bacterium]HNU09953.1 prepilin-type N-terminal cleavage/methylation domain-containing protein [Rubrivivax sp.]